MLRLQRYRCFSYLLTQTKENVCLVTSFNHFFPATFFLKKKFTMERCAFFIPQESSIGLPTCHKIGNMAGKAAAYSAKLSSFLPSVLGASGSAAGVFSAAFPLGNNIEESPDTSKLLALSWTYAKLSLSFFSCAAHKFLSLARSLFSVSKGVSLGYIGVFWVIVLYFVSDQCFNNFVEDPQSYLPTAKHEEDHQKQIETGDKQKAAPLHLKKALKIEAQS